MPQSKTQNLIVLFWQWYYAIAPKKILKTWRNVLSFGWNFFSIGLLFKTLFAPWKRDITKSTSGFDPKAWLESLVMNLISRLIGAFVRGWVILLGLFFEIIILIFGVLFFLGWLIFPALIVIGIIYAVIMIG
ncbi:MAG: hypothetical protein COU83_00455 [Candidatus Portnoybacteria bacterium CG10_big_fil_rev_8_21_14_0_10_40_22]|uniref:Uncharacterized protein n=1 Tax=Candidatus Portnoybacteria bacterium CG10_big_fil_rev_8_21_14_0_10_40_22 TaxID=1974814 RepID=A0A2M8KGV5_9BACT|nr:MAG: hypothetical protein COU83_00455 [Candidatus Portnoybacteria bacterium CG10_big_fil_rev_8_21_14_0_10_40_22]